MNSSTVSRFLVPSKRDVHCVNCLAGVSGFRRCMSSSICSAVMAIAARCVRVRTGMMESSSTRFFKFSRFYALSRYFSRFFTLQRFSRYCSRFSTSLCFSRYCSRFSTSLWFSRYCSRFSLHCGFRGFPAPRWAPVCKSLFKIMYLQSKKKHSTLIIRSPHPLSRRSASGTIAVEALGATLAFSEGVARRGVGAAARP